MSPRGLTIVEVLCATVLLTLVAGTCTSLLRRAAALADTAPAIVEIERLAALADRIMEDPTAFGFETVADALGAEVPWPEDAIDSIESNPHALPPITVRVFHSSDARADHEWLAFRCADQVVFRWRPRRSRRQP